MKQISNSKSQININAIACANETCNTENSDSNWDKFYRFWSDNSWWTPGKACGTEITDKTIIPTYGNNVIINKEYHM